MGGVLDFIGLLLFAGLVACILFWPRMLKGDPLPEEDIPYVKNTLD